MKISNKIICFFLTSIFIFGSFFVFDAECETKLSFGYPKLSFVLNVDLANAEEINHIIISEIQIAGEIANDEFIELYNPTDKGIDIEKFPIKLHIINSKGDDVNKDLIFISPNSVIKPLGYFLIASQKISEEYKNLINPDAFYGGTSLVSNGAVYISTSPKNNEGVIDSADWKDVVILKGQSLERDGNSFKIQAKPNPQNSSSVLNNGGQENSDQGDTEDTADDSSQDGSTQESGANGGNSAQNSSIQENESNNINNNYIPRIIITEFLPNPEGSDSDNEFIEIYNNDNVEADLAGWTLEDKIGKIKKFIIPEKTILKAGKYKVFYSDETRIALNNSGDGVILRNKNGIIISETSVSDSAKEDQSYALDKNGNWVWTLRLTPGRENIIKFEESNKNSNNKKQDSSAQENIVSNKQEDSTAFQDYGTGGGSEADGEQEYDFSDTIIISEIFPNPQGKDNQEENYEWIELHNTSDKDVNLKGWRIDDILDKGSKQYVIREDNIIKAGGYKIFNYNETKIMLNNSGDEVNVLWPDGEVIDSVKYERAVEGQSYSLTSGDNWIWTAEITPGKENTKKKEVLINENIGEDFEYIYIENNEDSYDKSELGNPDFIEADIEDLWHFEKHARVKIAGIVSVPPKIFSDRVFYLNGVQIFSYEIKLPKIELGDEVEIIGRISEVGGEKRILLEDGKDIKILSHSNLIEPKLISTGSANETTEGFLVMIEGKVSQVKNDIFYIDDGSGQVKIYIKPQTGIISPEIKIGDWMVITGQVSQTSAGYRILPRFKQDIKLSRVSGDSSTAKASSSSNENNNINNNVNNSDKISFIEYLFFIIVAIVLIDWGRMKKLKSKN